MERFKTEENDNVLSILTNIAMVNMNMENYQKALEQFEKIISAEIS